MIIEYTGRRTTVYPKYKSLVEAAMARIERLTDRCTAAHVVLEEDKYRKIAEVGLECGGEKLMATSEAVEMETALHDSLHKIELQAVRQKERYTTARDQTKPLTA